MNVNCFQVIEKQKIISGFKVLVVVCLINVQSVLLCRLDIYRLCLFNLK